MCEVTLAESADTAVVLTELSGLEVIEAPGRVDTPALAHPRLVFRAPDGMSTVYDAIGRLRAAEVEVIDIGLRQPSLDEVFLQLTDSA